MRGLGMELDDYQSAEVEAPLDIGSTQEERRRADLKARAAKERERSAKARNKIAKLREEIQRYEEKARKHDNKAADLEARLG